MLLKKIEKIIDGKIEFISGAFSYARKNFESYPCKYFNNNIEIDNLYELYENLAEPYDIIDEYRLKSDIKR